MCALDPFSYYFMNDYPCLLCHTPRVCSHSYEKSPRILLRVPNRRIYSLSVKIFLVVNIVKFIVFLTITLSFKFHGLTSLGARGL